MQLEHQTEANPLNSPHLLLSGPDRSGFLIPTCEIPEILSLVKAKYLNYTKSDYVKVSLIDLRQQIQTSNSYSRINSPVCFPDPEDTYSQDWIPEQMDKRLSEFLGGPGKRVSEFLGGPGKRVSEFLGGPGKRVSEFLGGPGKRVSEFLGGPGKRVSEFLGGPGKRVSEFLGGPGKRHAAGNLLHGSESKRVSEFLGGPGKRSQFYEFLENSNRR